MARPDDLRYTSSHEWIRVEGTIATIGITDHAVEQLSDLVFIDLPEVGREVTRDSPVGEIESTKTVADLNAPVSGTIIEVNSELVDNLERVNDSPFDAGWMIKIEMTDTGELESLLDAAGYQKVVDEE